MKRRKVRDNRARKVRKKRGMLEYRHGYPEIEEYWRSLRKDFFDWIEANDLSGWGVHMYPDY